jgi:hypothetical protein
VPLLYEKHVEKLDVALLVFDETAPSTAGAYLPEHKLRSFLDSVAIPLGTQIESHDRVRIGGFPERNPSRFSVMLAGTVDSAAATVGSGRAIRLHVPAFAAQHAEVPRGISGGPMLRRYPDGTERAVGVVFAFPPSTEGDGSLGGEVLGRHLADLRHAFPGVDHALQRSGPVKILGAIADTVPPSSRSPRSRDKALDLAWKQSQARRTTRLQPVPSDRLDAVLGWMKDLDDDVADVPEGQIRVLVAPMGAGKSEQASRWWDEALRAAQANVDVEIPIWLHARRLTAGLEPAVTQSIGDDPKKPCWIVIDDLDSVSSREANQLLDEARQLVQVWPKTRVLATSRPGVSTTTPNELIKVDPWPVQRGIDLVRLVVGNNLPWRIWSPETLELMKSPLLALALAARLSAGGDVEVSRLQLLSGLARTIIERRRPERATTQTWDALARLAGHVLDSQGLVTAESFGNESQIWQLTDTGLVVNDEGMLSFALPVFEQHFGSQVIKSGMVRLEAAAGAASFPGWRYAIAFTISTSEPRLAEEFMVRLARINPAAASWVLDEIAYHEKYVHDWRNLDNAAIQALIRKLRTPEHSEESHVGLLAGRWLREAFQALLDGLGPLGEQLASHRDGRLVQWGAWADGGQVTIAEARESLPPPDVVHLTKSRPEITLSSGWRGWQQFTFPSSQFGRWLWARKRLRNPLTRMIQRRTLPVPSGSQLARERLWFLAQFVMNNRYGRPLDAIPLAPFRDKIAEMMAVVQNSVESSWQFGSYTADSADIRWVDAQLKLEMGEALKHPRPAPDQPQAVRKWAWQGYPPGLTQEILTGVLRDAIIGYQELVELSLPNFGPALGLYSLLPVRIEGIVARFEDDEEDQHGGLLFALKHDSLAHRGVSPCVELELLTDRRSDQRWQFSQAFEDNRQSGFHLPTLEDVPLPLYSPRPATNFAYEWLARDLKALGWLSEDVRFYD